MEPVELFHYFPGGLSSGPFLMDWAFAPNEPVGGVVFDPTACVIHGTPSFYRGRGWNPVRVTNGDGVAVVFWVRGKPDVDPHSDNWNTVIEDPQFPNGGSYSGLENTLILRPFVRGKRLTFENCQNVCIAFGDIDTAAVGPATNSGQAGERDGIALLGRYVGGQVIQCADITVFECDIAAGVNGIALTEPSGEAGRDYHPRFRMLDNYVYTSGAALWHSYAHHGIYCKGRNAWIEGNRFGVSPSFQVPNFGTMPSRPNDKSVGGMQWGNAISMRAGGVARGNIVRQCATAGLQASSNSSADNGRLYWQVNDIDEVGLGSLLQSGMHSSQSHIEGTNPPRAMNAGLGAESWSNSSETGNDNWYPDDVRVENNFTGDPHNATVGINFFNSISGTTVIEENNISGTIPPNAKPVNCIARSRAANANGPGPWSAAGESLSASVTYDGVTFTFDKAMPVGTFADGSPYVVATEAFAVTETSTPSEVYQSNWINGMAFGSAITNEAGVNGFDERTGTIGGRTAYTDALNVDPGRRGEPVAIAQGTNDVLVKAKSLLPHVGNFHFIERYGFLTILAESPPAGSFRPPILGNDRVPQFTEADLDYDVLSSLAMPASLRTAAQCLDRIPPAVMTWQWTPDQNRVLKTEGTFNGQSGNYSREYAQDRLEALIRLHSDIPNAEKRDLLVRMVQMGLDFLSGRAFGENSVPDGGLTQGIIPPAFLAALVLGDNTLLSLAQSILANENAQIFWVGEADIGRAVRYPSHTREWYHQTYQQVQLGLPDYHIRAEGSTADNTTQNADLRADYRFSNGPAAMAPLVIGLLQGGEAAWINGPADQTNARYATFGYMDRLRRFMPVVDDWLRPQVYGAYDAHRDKLTTPIWTGVPDPLYIPDLEAQDGAIGYTLHVWTGEQGGAPIRHDLSYSVDPMRRGPHPNNQGNLGSLDTPDPRQWIVVEDVGLSGSIPNLTPGLSHQVRVRCVTSEGVGPWSKVGPWRDVTDSNQEQVGLLDLAEVTPTGSPANAAPVNTVAPKLFRKIGSHNGPSEYVEETGTIGESTTRLFVGVGYWTGAPAPTFTYQWQRDGVDIAGAAGDFYDIQGADLGTDVSCVVTATNSEAAVTATTTALEVPAEVVTTALWTPTGTVGEVPSIFDPSLGWWHASGDPRTIEFQDNPLPQVQFVPRTTANTAYSNMMPITSLGAIDDLSAVAEGEVVFQVRRQQAAAGGREGLVIRGHRDSDTEGRGYLFGMFYRSDGIWALNVIRLDGTGHEILVSQATMTESVSAGSTTMARLRWTEDAGDLVLHGRYWLSGSAEPSEWALDGYRIESPYPPGMIGLGTHAARTAVLYRRIGLSLDPLNTPAPVEPG